MNKEVHVDNSMAFVDQLYDQAQQEVIEQGVDPVEHEKKLVASDKRKKRDAERRRDEIAKATRIDFSLAPRNEGPLLSVRGKGNRANTMQMTVHMPSELHKELLGTGNGAQAIIGLCKYALWKLQEEGTVLFVNFTNEEDQNKS